MPDRSAHNSGPQVEDGYTRYANELLEALCKLKCRNADRRMIDAVARLTYGIYGRKKAKIENNELADMTGMSISQVCRARRRLVARNILKVSSRGNQKVLTYSINKHYRTWKKLPPAEIIEAEQKEISASVNDDTAGGKEIEAGGNSTLYKENNKKTQKKKPAPPPYQNIIEYLNALTGSKYDYKGKETRAMIRARFASGFTEQDFYDVIKVKADQWIGDNKMQSYLRPSTLFRPTNFEDYLQEARRSKSLGLSEKQRAKERRFKIAAAILRDEGQDKCLAYCQGNNVDPEQLTAWMAKTSNEDLLNGS